ncbi:MAG: imidazoleglycerol-phosphate dehydratase HisB [Rickettsiales bacterium]|nr:imidazoleglycerol-phosphate dehydratase HisB [Rickettsiales bacterium]
MRKAKVTRKTNETDVTVEINIDGSGSYSIDTGIAFFDHMLEQLSKHSLIDISLKAVGDIHVDFHHTCEDVGIVLGKAMSQALENRAGINRFAHSYVPMDDVLTLVAVDISGRPASVFDVEFSGSQIGNMDVELFNEWFHAFSGGLKANIHVKNLYGFNNHHKIESCYKALALSLKTAFAIDPRKEGVIPSTKGTI